MRKTLLLVLLLCFGFTMQAQKFSKETIDLMSISAKNLELEIQKLSAPSSIKLMAVGDIMMGTDFPNKGYLPPDGKGPFDDVNSVLKEANILFGNLEGTLTDTGKNAKHCSDPSK